jgi:hypothetical protein
MGNRRGRCGGGGWIGRWRTIVSAGASWGGVWLLAGMWLLMGPSASRAEIAEPGAVPEAEVEQPEETALPESLPADGTFQPSTDPLPDPAPVDYLDLLVELLLQALEEIAAAGGELYDIRDIPPFEFEPEDLQLFP